MIYKRQVSSFARRVGKKIGNSQAELLENYLPEVSPIISKENKTIINLNDIFVTNKQFDKFVLEIGFGGGEHVAEMAKLAPNTGFIASEPFMNGVASLLKKMKEYKLENIVIWSDDINLLLPYVPEHSINQIFILFPDPWPKKKHHKRRIVNQKLLSKLAKIMTKEGKISIATDHMEYASWILNELLLSEDFYFPGPSNHNWQTFPNNWISTRYQIKALKKGINSFLFEFKYTC